MKDLYIHLPRRPRFMAVPLACALLLAGCGGGSDEPEPTHTSRYPTLAAHASMDEEDFDRYLLTAGRGTNITPETIKSLSVGSSINAAASTYNLRPIFDLGRLKEDGRLNVDTTRSRQTTALRITSSKAASTASSQTRTSPATSSAPSWATSCCAATSAPPKARPPTSAAASPTPPASPSAATSWPTPSPTPTSRSSRAWKASSPT